MNWNPETIVVGVDGSTESHRAVELATSMARRFDSQLKIVTVIRTPEGWWGIGGAPPSPDALAEAISRGREEVLNEVEANHDFTSIGYELVEELGDPFTRLVAVCEETDADLLVIGRRGAGLAERVILGSTADRLTHHAPCPVLVVP